jgi:photosystem II stability/assembly factor-like uncharacterized protein
MWTLPADAEWRQLGPFGGSAQAIVQDPQQPNILLASTRDGLLYRSFDRGDLWTPLHFPGELAVAVQVLAVSGGDIPLYYLGLTPGNSGQAGLYRSNDRGQTWQPLEGLRNEPVFSLAIWSKDPRIIVAGSQNGVFLSRDSGDSWKRISPVTNRELQPVTSIAFDPASADVIYAGTTHLPWKTSDGGKTWQSVHGGMIDDSDVFSIQVDPVNHERVFASACSGIYRSDNGGASWIKLLGIPRTSRRTYTIRQDPLHRNVVYAGTSQGLWKSVDEGATWRQVSSAIVKSIAFDTTEAPRLYLATEDAGLLTSTDGVRTLQPINQGFVNRNFTTLISDASGFLYTSNLYSRSDTGVYRMSSSVGWRPAGLPGTRSLGNVLAVVPAEGNTLFARTYDSLLRSTDAGTTWAKLTMPGSSSIQSLQVLRGQPRRILAGTTTGLYVSDDLGFRWRRVIEGAAIEGIFVSPLPDQLVVVHTRDGLWLSSDAGQTWNSIASPSRSDELYDVAISPSGVLLAGTARGAFRSFNRGDSWEPVMRGLSAGTIHLVLFHPSQRLAFAVLHGRVYQSNDDGTTWLALNMDGLENASISSLAISPAEPERLFVLARARGVFVSPVSSASESAGRQSTILNWP